MSDTGRNDGNGRERQEEWNENHEESQEEREDKQEEKRSVPTWGRSTGYMGSRRTMMWIVLGILLAFVLFRTGFFEQWGNQPPVRYILSDPEITTERGRTEVSYWLHVPVGTETATTEDLISNFIIREVSRHVVDEFRISEADMIRFYVFDTPRNGTDELKTAKIDDPDHVYRFTEEEGLVAEQ